MQNFVTLFDKNYLSRGIVLYESLCRECKEEFRLYILAMDERVPDVFESRYHQNVVLFTVDNLIDMYPILKTLREQRTATEFCWTLSSFSLQYVMREFGLDSCTYVDADMCFYNDPQILIQEMQQESVLITEHNFYPKYDQTVTSGKFCVQFMYFKNNTDGNEVLEWWRSKCEENCSSKSVDGQFGDQKYLDDWESRFEGKVYNCRDIGCGVAPWNLQKYEIRVENNKYFVQDKVSKIKRPLVFFHYHGLLKLCDNKWRLTGNGYDIGKDFVELLYRNYISDLCEREIRDEKNCRGDVCVEVKNVRVVKFSPIPYYEKSQLDMNIEGNTEIPEHIIRVTDKTTGEKGSIHYEKKSQNGQWIYIKRIEEKAFILRHFHEILWTIQYRECFSDCVSINEAVYEIAKRKRAGEWLMTECLSDILGTDEILHPEYIYKEIVRVYKNEQEYFEVFKNNIVIV